MKEYFFSSKNINKLLGYFEKYIRIKNINNDIKKKCRHFLLNRMKLVFKIYGDKRPDDIKKKKFLEMLNKKTLIECIKLYKERKNIKYSKHREDKKKKKLNLTIGRDMEIYGNRKVSLSSRPKYTEYNEDDNKHNLSYLSNREIPDYAPVVGRGKRYITATGESTNKKFTDNEDNYIKRNDNSFKSDIEMKMLERSSWYDNNSMNRPNEIDFTDNLNNIKKFNNVEDFVQNRGRPSFKEFENERNIEYSNEDFNQQREIPNMNDFNQRREIPNMNDFNQRREIPNMNDFNQRREIPNMNDSNQRREIPNMNDSNQRREIPNMNDSNQRREIPNMNDFNRHTEISNMKDLSKRREKPKIKKINKVGDGVYGVNKKNSNEFSSLNEAFNNDIHKNIETFNNFNNNRSYQDLINERSKLSNISDDNIDKNKIISMTDNTSDFDNIENINNNNNIQNIQNDVNTNNIDKLNEMREKEIQKILNSNKKSNTQELYSNRYDETVNIKKNSTINNDLHKIYKNRIDDTKYINNIQKGIDVGPSITDINNLYNQLKTEIDFQRSQKKIEKQISNIPVNLLGSDKLNSVYESFNTNKKTDYIEKDLDIDIEQAMSLLKNERETLDTRLETNKGRKPFDPTISPYSKDNSNVLNQGLNIDQLLNLQKKEELLLNDSLKIEDLNKITIEDIQNKIDLLKTSKLSVTDIQKKIDFFKTIINNQKKKTKEKEDDNKDDNKDYSIYVKELVKKKNELLNIVEKLKNQNNNKYIIEDSSDEDVCIDYTNIINDDSEEYDNNTIVKDNSVNIDDVFVSSKEYSKNNNYNTYSIPLKKEFKNVIGLELGNCNIPSNNYNIIPSNNSFEYIINHRRKIIRIQEGKYNIGKLIKALHVGFEKYGDKIKITINNDYITITNLDRIKFYIVNCNKTISKLLGFKKINYENEYVYKGDEKFNLNVKNILYLFINNISNSYFAKIDSDNKTIILSKRASNFVNNPKKLRELNIIFKYSVNNNKKDYYHFNNKPHTLIFKIITKKEKEKEKKITKINYKFN
jgi:hypothetical protein